MWEQFRLEKLHFEGSVNSLVRRRCLPALALQRQIVCLCSSLLRSFHPFLSADLVICTQTLLPVPSAQRQAQAAVIEILQVLIKGESDWDPYLVSKCGATWMFFAFQKPIEMLLCLWYFLYTWICLNSLSKPCSKLCGRSFVGSLWQHVWHTSADISC